MMNGGPNVNYTTEMSKIKKGQLQPVYLFLGKEDFFIEEAKQLLLRTVVDEADKDLNVGIFNMDGTLVDRALEDAESLPFFGERRLVIIENPLFLTAEKSKNGLEHDLGWLESYLENPAPSTVLAIFAPYEKLDSRKKIAKLLTKKAVTVDVSPLAEKEARKFLGDMIKNEGYQMNRDALELFYERIENQLSRGMRELPKLFLSGSEDKKITKQMVIDLIPRNLEQNIFELVTQVLNKNTYLAIQIYRDLLLQKEEPIKVNAILLGQFRLLLQVKLLSKNGYQQTDITKVLKVHPYRVKLAFQQVRHLSEKVLADAFQGLVETEYNMKTGQGLKEIQFELFLIRYANAMPKQ